MHELRRHGAASGCRAHSPGGERIKSARCMRLGRPQLVLLMLLLLVVKRKLLREILAPWIHSLLLLLLLLLEEDLSHYSLTKGVHMLLLACRRLRVRCCGQVLVECLNEWTGRYLSGQMLLHGRRWRRERPRKGLSAGGAELLLLLRHHSFEFASSPNFALLVQICVSKICVLKCSIVCILSTFTSIGLNLLTVSK